MKDLYISDISDNQVLLNFVVGIKSVIQGTDKNNNTYYDLELVDKTGLIRGKIWSDKLQRIEKSAMKKGNVVTLQGVAKLFKGVLQITIDDLNTVSEDEFDMDDLTKELNKDIDKMWGDLLDRIENLEDKQLKELANNCIKEYGEQIQIAPAAERLHHGYRGGLLEHMTEMFDHMDVVKKYYPDADFDLITVGIIFHDLGKLKELKMDGFNIFRTDKGRLIGHLSLSVELFLQCLPEDFPKKKKVHIQHLILSHHGILEYGSPVMPKTIEAIILHKLDDFSSTIKQYQRVLEENQGSEQNFSQRDWALGTEVYLR